MKKKYIPIYSLVILITIVASFFYFMMPQYYDEKEAALSEFSTQRALATVKKMSSKPHFVGSKNHEKVAQYLEISLRKLGLKTTIQQGYTMTETGTLVQSKNIIARIKGTDNTKALLLLSHYDSAPNSYSKGASDDASGVATILESVRAFLHNKTPHNNDVIILFTDAEELGLNGAALFVTQHQWAKEVGLVLNLEARGSSGPSYMLMETNQGNAKMVDAFSNGNVEYPVSNSLMYSIYKLLPNDTDLTILKEKGEIQGFNFAFIDNHFNYHSIQDNYYNLDKNSLAHQGTYLFSLLNYFSNSDLSSLNSKDDKVYFNIPFGFVSYPFGWILPLFLIAFSLFILFTFIGLGKRTLHMEEIIKGFIPLFSSLLITGLVSYIGWKLILNFYPNYQDILQGFTYNGHSYIYAFVSLSLAICFLFYQNRGKRKPEMSQTVSSLFLWLLINIGIILKLPGAAFLIIPVLSSTLMLGFFVVTQKSNWLINHFLAIPTLVLIVPFIFMLPVGLGLKILFGSSLLTVLAFSLLLPVFGSFPNKGLWAGGLLIISIAFFAMAHIDSGYSKSKPKPNSLVYILNSDTNQAYWTTYDVNLDEWTKPYLRENPKAATSLNHNKIYSKYDSEFTLMAKAPIAKIAKPTVEFLRDTIKGNQHLFHIKINPNRTVNRYDIFNNNGSKINNLKANGVRVISYKSNILKNPKEKIITYFVVDNTPLDLEFSINKKYQLDVDLLESSIDLVTNPLLKIKKRKEWMIPTPFVLNDAIIIKRNIKPTSLMNVKTKKITSELSTQKENAKLTLDTAQK